MIKKTLIICALGAVLCPANAFAGRLDGTSWKMKPKGFIYLLMFWRSDTLAFKEGKFTSAFALKHAFRPRPYLGGANWSSILTSGAGEKMQWQGTRMGKKMTGTVTWTKIGGDKKIYRWKARLK